ncbi:MAG: hypothetical protein IMZ61_00230 [Planctomycetes bacterium]|nr:hypothetical protein [Planctomycetota bacterium]
MTAAEFKQIIVDNGIDRKELAGKIGISPVYLNLILNGWAVLKGEHEEALKGELLINNNNNKMLCSKVA